MHNGHQSISTRDLHLLIVMKTGPWGTDVDKDVQFTFIKGRWQ